MPFSVGGFSGGVCGTDKIKTSGSTFNMLQRSIKPDFHSNISLVASEFFRLGHAQSGEMNRSVRKNIFHSVRI